MKLSWSKESMLKLLEIEQYIEKNNPKKAVEFTDFLISQGEVLSDTPYIGRIVKEISNPSIRELIVNNYRIVYKIQEQDVIILTVFEGHRLIRSDEIT